MNTTHKKHQFRLPGPTPSPLKVKEAAKAVIDEPINHRGPEFTEIMLPLIEKLKKIFQTNNRIFILGGAGTLGMQSAVLNLCGSENDKTSLFLINGHFGERFQEIALRFRIDHGVALFDCEKSIDGDVLLKEMGTGLKHIDILFFVHNESSTGITNDAESIIKAAHKYNPEMLIAVDAISSLGGIDIPTDKWGIDFLITSTQKALMTPSGLTIVSVSERAFQRAYKTNFGFYESIPIHQKYLEKGQTPASAILPCFAGLDAATDLILEEKLDNTFRRHSKIARFIKENLASLGFQILGDKDSTSLTITAAKLPQEIKERCDSKSFVKYLKEKEGLEISASIKGIGGEIIRIGHMGYINMEDAKMIIAKIKNAVEKI